MEMEAQVIENTVTSGRIRVEGTLLERAIGNDEEAIQTIFNQFIENGETFFQAQYYGYFGFWFVGFHSFCCLTDKRIAVIRIGPFKKIHYEDGFYENITSGGVFQPSKFWLYVMLVIGVLAVFALVGIGLTMLLSFLFVEVFGLYDSEMFIYFIAALGSSLFIPFTVHAVSMSFYRLNPCGLACWLRERRPIFVFVNREKMIQANRLYRKWTEVRELRNKHLKNRK